MSCCYTPGLDNRYIQAEAGCFPPGRLEGEPRSRVPIKGPSRQQAIRLLFCYTDQEEPNR